MDIFLIYLGALLGSTWRRFCGIEKFGITMTASHKYLEAFMTTHSKPIKPSVVGSLIFHLLLCLTPTFLPHTTMAQHSPVIIGVLENWPPQYGIDTETGLPTGFAVDIMNEVSRLSGLDIQYRIFKTWPMLNQALREKKIDVIPNMGITKEREPYFNYTVPIETTKILFIVRETSTDIKNVDDLDGRVVSVVETNKGRFLMEERNWKNLRIYQSLEEALMALIGGVSDAFVYPDPPLYRILDQYGLRDKVKTIGEPLFEVKRAIAVHKDNTELLNKLNDSVNVLLSSTDYTNIYKKWYGKSAVFWTVKRLAVVMGGFILAVSLALFIWRFFTITRLNKKLLLQTQKREQAEEELQKFHHIFYHAGWGMVVAAPDTHIITAANPAFSKMHGYNMEEVVGMHLGDFLAEENRKNLSTHADIVHERDHHIYESLHIRKDGSTFPCLANVTAFKDEAGRVLFRAATLEVITARKRIEEALRKSEEKYRLLFEKSLNGFALHEIVVDRNGKPVDYVFLEVNPAFEKFMGTERDNLLGKKATDVLPKVAMDPADWIGEFGNVATTGHGVRFEQYSPTLDKWYSVTSFRPEKGRFATIFEDTTEKKRAEAALYESEERFSTTFMTNPLPASLTRLSDSKLMEVNNAWCRLMGFSREESVGRSVEELKIIDRETTLRLQDEYFRQGYLKNFETMITTNRREKREILTYMAPIRVSGEEFSINMIIDITELKLAKVKLRESEEKHWAFFNHSPIGLFILDVGDPVRYIAVNDTLAQINNRPVEEHIGKPISEVFPDTRLAGDIENILRELIQTKLPVTFESSGISGDGRQIHYIAQYFPIMGADGEPTAIGGALLDITERKEAELAMETYSEQLEENVRERTADLRKIIDAMAGRELRMAELKQEIAMLQDQLHRQS